MDTVQAVLLSLLTTFGGLGAIGWLLKTYIDRRLQHAYKKRDRSFEFQAKTTEKYIEHIHDVRLTAVPEISEIAYRLRNLFRANLTTWGEDEVARASELWAQFADCLYKYRIFLPENTFFILHRYNAAVRGLVLHLSSEASNQSLVSNGRRDKAAAELTASYVNHVNELFPAVTNCLTDLMQPPKEAEIER